tara:strand:- start:7609 stop:8229 length:621 start_codon:yes stop_codon:yes gene_type:complete
MSKSSVNLIPILGTGLQRYQENDLEAVDPLNTMEIFQSEIWPHIEGNFTSESKILDIGCGNGRYTSFLSERTKSVHAVDAFRDINENHHRKNVLFSRTEFQNFKEKDFDVIFMFGVFYLQESWGTRLAFKKMVSSLKDGGVIITIDDKVRDLRHDVSENLAAGFYNLDELCREQNVKIVDEFIQQNKVHRVTVIMKAKEEAPQVVT